MCSDVGGGVGEHGDADDRRWRTAPTTSRPPAAAAGPRASRRPARRGRPPTSSSVAMIPTCHQRVGRRAGRHPGRDRRHQQHDGRVVEARLGLEHPGDLPGQRHPAQHGEHGRGIGGGEHGGDEEGDLPGPAEEEVRGDPDDQHRHADPDGREHGGRRDRPADAGPPGREPALDEDQHERGVPEHLGELLVLVVDAEARLAQHQPDAEVDAAATAGPSAATGAPRRPPRRAPGCRRAGPG